MVESIIYNFKPNNRKITNDTYISRIKKILERNINPEDTDKVKEYLEGFSYKTKRSYYIALVVFFKASGKDPFFYENCVKTMGDKIQHEDKKNEATVQEKKNLVKKEEMQKIIGNLEEIILKMEEDGIKNLKYFKILQNYLVINLYFLVPPIRNDYVIVDVYNTLPGSTSDEKNYILLHDKKLVLNRYKTDKTYGQLMVTLPGKIIDIISKVFEKRQEIFPYLKDERALLLNSNLKRMSKVNLIQNLNSIFKRNVSVTMLRKSYISEKYPVEYTIEDMEKDAKTMGHSVSLQQSTYRKKM